MLNENKTRLNAWHLTGVRTINRKLFLALTRFMANLRQSEQIEKRNIFRLLRSLKIEPFRGHIFTMSVIIY